MLIDIGEIRLNYAEWGTGEDTVVFIRGNLACGMWFDLIGPPDGGCDKPAGKGGFPRPTDAGGMGEHAPKEG